MFARIIIDIAAEQVDRLYTYKIPDEMRIQRGMRVDVPFGRQIREGYVLDLIEKADLDECKIKDIIAPLDDYPPLLPCMIDLAQEMKEKYHCCLCDTLRLMIPAEMRRGRVHVKQEVCAHLTVSSEEALNLAAYQKRSPQKKLFLEVLSDGEYHSFSELRVIIRSVSSIVKFFEEQGIVESVMREVLRQPSALPMSRITEPSLTSQQQEVTDEVMPAIRCGKEKVFLLHGITGSGKTEVYIRLVKSALREGGSAIILVPEIVLTPQMIDYFRSRFGNASAVLHSKLSAGERYDEWRRIRRGDAKIVIGARSAVFAPLEDLKLIVVDEEHEQSYISEKKPQYDARETALMRARREGAVVLLASATPSIYSYAMARRGDYTLLEMDKRANGKPLPQVHIVDMRKELQNGNKSMFSVALMDKLKVCISGGHQAILFLNRRGYAPVMKCRRCGATIKCENCDISMAYHSTDDMLHCHYCGERRRVPSVCPACGSTYIRTIGIGTQKVEEELRKLFPDIGIVRMDVDTTGGKNDYLDLLNRFRSGDASILLGTQMIAKGLDFPNVTLVGAVMADMTLELPDFRSPERTYQLLVQVAGRAGRAAENGEVIIQTYRPDHYAIVSAAKQDYRQFFNEEFSRRRKDLYPPFTGIIRLLCEDEDENKAMKTAIRLQEGIVSFLESNAALKRRMLFMRCDKAPIGRIQNMYRAQVLMKVLNHPDSELLKERCAELACAENECRVICEFDPANMG